jgi:hypothetical protein
MAMKKRYGKGRSHQYGDRGMDIDLAKSAGQIYAAAGYGKLLRMLPWVVSRRSNGENNPHAVPVANRSL